MKTSLAVLVVSFLLGVVIYPAFISLLARHHIGQRVADYTPGVHYKKTGTPTVGGALFCLPPVIAWVIFDRHPLGFVPVFALLAGAVMGLLDDVANVFGTTATYGLMLRQKVLLQLTIGVLIGTGLYVVSLTHQWIPIVGNVDFGVWIIPITALAIVAASNAVNLTDGVDGLCASCSVVALCALWIIGLQQNNRTAVIVSASLVGVLCAFLVYNWSPARVFMGDAGSLALGSAMVALAAALHVIWMLPLIGIVFVIETLSVIINVTAITRFHRRIFLSSPLHHHFEAKGMRDGPLVTRFALVGVVGAAGALVLVRGAGLS